MWPVLRTKIDGVSTMRLFLCSNFFVNTFNSCNIPVNIIVLPTILQLEKLRHKEESCRALTLITPTTLPAWKTSKAISLS